MDREKYKRTAFGNNGRNGCSPDAHFRKAKVAENQTVIEKNIHKYHDDNGIGKHLGFCKSDVQGAVVNIDYRKENCKGHDGKVLVGLCPNCIRAQYKAEKHR